MKRWSAGRECPGSGAAGPQSGYGLDSKTATAGYTALCLPYFPANPFPGGLVDSQPRLTLPTGSTRATYAPGTSFLGSSGRRNRASASATVLAFARQRFGPAETGPKKRVEFDPLKEPLAKGIQDDRSVTSLHFV